MKGTIYSKKRNNRRCFLWLLIFTSLLWSADAQQKATFVAGSNYYYAGQDIQLERQNYLEPVDASLKQKINAKDFLRISAALQSTEPVKTVTAARRNGEEWNPDGIEMVFVEGGTFMMGCTSEQGDHCIDFEKPAHRVTVSDFYIGRYEVTQAQWEAVMGTTVRQQRDKANPQLAISGEGDNYPMYYVSWDETQEFVRRLNLQTGKQYRLPTEAEWEYAARGQHKQGIQVQWR